MKNKLMIPLIFVSVGVVACGGDGARRGDQKAYETVQEGSASGVTSTISGPGEALPAITGTNADTTTAFTIDPNVATTPGAPPAGSAPGTLAGTLPPPASPAMVGTTPYPRSAPPPMTSAQPGPRPAQPVSPRPAQPEPQPVEEPPATDTTNTTTAADTTNTQPPQQQPVQPKPAEQKPPVEQEEPEEEPPPPPTATDTRGN